MKSRKLCHNFRLFLLYIIEQFIILVFGNDESGSGGKMIPQTVRRQLPGIRRLKGERLHSKNLILTNNIKDEILRINS